MESNTEQPGGAIPSIRLRARRAAAYILVYAILLVIVSACLFPALPRTAKCWLAVLIFGPPLYLLGESLSEKFTAPWGEATLTQKAAKASLIIIVAIALLLAQVFFFI